MLSFTVYREGNWGLERECNYFRFPHLISDKIWIQIPFFFFFWFQSPCIFLPLANTLSLLHLCCGSDLLDSKAISLSLDHTCGALRCGFKFHVYNSKWHREEKLKICHPEAAPSSQEEGFYLQRRCSCLTNCVWQESCCVRAFLQKAKIYWHAPSI